VIPCSDARDVAGAPSRTAEREIRVSCSAGYRLRESMRIEQSAIVSPVWLAASPQSSTTTWFTKPVHSRFSSTISSGDPFTLRISTPMLSRARRPVMKRVRLDFLSRKPEQPAYTFGGNWLRLAKSDSGGWFDPI
jgi:hypothetical protein